MSRSAAQQLTHWARLGRELEASRHVNNKDIERVLTGKLPYDSLADQDQAVVRSAWAERIDLARGSLDLEAEFIESGETWSEVDTDGTVVVRNGR